MTVTAAPRTSIYTPALGRDVYLRPGTTDRAVWNETFTGRYHVPPASMPTPRTVLDLGSNIGLTVAHYQTMWPAAFIVGAEPDPDTLAVAYSNTDAIILNLAVVGTPGAGMLLRRGGEWGHRLSRDGDLLVTCVPLDCLIAEWFENQPVDFCKMDIEGGEWDVFGRAGEWRHLVRHLLVELHPSDEMEDDTAHLRACGAYLLREAGFRVEPHSSHRRALWAVQQ